MKITMITRIYAVIGIAILGLCLSYSSIANEAEDKAMEAAKAWMELIDEGKYAESWQEAAVYFKNAMTKYKWEQVLTGVRKPLGKIVSRKLKAKISTKALPGAPDGDYLIIQFTTSFENKRYGIETVIPMLDKDGKWRVAGYYIQ